MRSKAEGKATMKATDLTAKTQKSYAKLCNTPPWTPPRGASRILIFKGAKFSSSFQAQGSPGTSTAEAGDPNLKRSTDSTGLRVRPLRTS